MVMGMNNVLTMCMSLCLAALLGAVLISSGCVQQAGPVPDAGTIKERAIELCIAACESAKESGTTLDNGPCVSEEIVEDWVCDVAHDPRQPIDNEPQNQCSSYRAGQTHHFVEVDTDCNLIRAV